ncbi:MAG: divergent PAP2 family protein [Spirochaetaceae bacterium]|jgi:acid phosphatase family membrane protein YuiD|nr:divergent PAP2 family protein [Spirochaetaceae bacterium]
MKAFLQNPVLLSAFFSWLSSQFIKTVISLLSGRISSFKELLELLFWRTGKMPSSHSALVCSICTSIGIRDGVDSTIFVLACCFALVVIRDAVGVRRSSGIQAKTLNKLGNALKEKEIVSFTPVKEVQGHTPLEVLVGGLLGCFIALAFSML